MKQGHNGRLPQKTSKASPLYERIAGLISQARQTVIRNTNSVMVYTYYEIGRMIVEDEQKGSKKAEYGEQVLEALAQKLTKAFGKGFSVTNLRQMRSFYLVYGAGQIRQTLSDEFKKRFKLSWSHYVKLMRIDDKSERRFYEIECVNNGWSIREFERQFNSALYERLALSKNKKGVKFLAVKGQLVVKPEDAIKDPYILEFTGLPELARYSETDLENQLLDKMESFLLELGKGFTFVGRQVRFTFDEQHFRVDLVFYSCRRGLIPRPLGRLKKY